MVKTAVVVLGLALVLSGCGGQPGPEATPTETALSPTPSASPPHPDSIEAKLALFDQTNTETIAANDTVNGRAFIDALAAAGFDKAQMELTSDMTAIGLGADNIQFSVLFGDECLVGQYGNVGYHSAVLPPLSTGQCLIGKTRPIDW